MRPLSLSFPAAALAATLLLGSCARGPELTAQRQVASGDQYVANKQFAEAILEYRSALQKQPGNGEARLKLARAYVASNDFRNAYPEYLRVGDLMTSDLDVQAEIGNILLLGRRFDEAKTRARSILQKNPSHLPALVLLGNALAGLNDLDSAVAVAERVTAINSARQGGYLNLGVLRMAKGDEAEAEQALLKAVALDPRSSRAHLALGNYYRASGKIDAAEGEFQQAVSLEPRNFRANRAMAAFYVEVNRADQAEPYLQRVAQTINDASSWLEYADLLASIGKTDDALKVLGRVKVDSEHNRPVRIRMAEITHSAGRTAEAHSILTALRQEGDDADVLAADARLLLTEAKLDQALSRAREALQTNPNAEDAHLVTGQILVARGDFEEGRREFNEVLNLSPGDLTAHMELSKLHLTRREIDTAITVARDAVRLYPTSIPVRIALIDTLLARPDDAAKARQETETLAREYPMSPAAHAALGRYYLAVNNRPAAYKAFERALALDPGSVSTLSQVVAMDMSAGRSREARKRLATELEKRPRDLPLVMMAAKVMLAGRHYPQAEQLLRRVVELDSANIEAYTLLGQLFVAQQRLPDAVREFSLVVERDPKSSSAHTMLGLLLHAQHRVPEAVRHYEQALESDPRAVTAANNLAWLLAENDQQLDRAYQLAQIAKGERPNNPEILDTAGWVYFKRGMLALAVTALEQAVEAAPKSALYNYHLGIAYAKQGDDADARKALQRALALEPRFERADHARQVLSTLVY
jgi:tetratricopeptide (TPR) repeat protein